METRKLDGRAVSRTLIDEMRAELATLDFTPKLVFVRAGDDPASASYVRSKARLAARAGIEAVTHALPGDVSQKRLLDLIGELGADDDVDGILVQLPLPGHLDPAPILEAVPPGKDVDGFHPVNVGRLWSGETGLFPATPSGLIRILDHYEIEIEGRHVVIVNRSNLVGKPAAALFLRRHATVTLAHSRTRDLPGLTRSADIVVTGVGRPGFLEGAMLTAGAVVLDVGQAPDDGVLRGDAAPSVEGVAAGLTPTPGGTGPMTVAMVIRNTLSAATLRRTGA
jgi:methylenetetrahydrofolate dehydrogenase (NADP+)/methenyltetrahydrofolate cyclohydrolase